MPNTDLASGTHARPRTRRHHGRPAHLAHPLGPARWDPPPLVPEDAEALRQRARHFGTTALPPQHHWVLDSFLLVAGVLVLVLLLL